ncbi:hypothetical protein AOQ84DRAFT_391468 [Glonium stellatum]|uniref:Uncharacterized protein n=1 Tax=Glonium stellatum TaxID=574774 RepID=A0A8E2ETG5_9PEZI|nr:hypothetical protein AOQ84DRAFT_391468 [Glonium stellatum]
MGGARGIFPVTLGIVFGVATAIATLDPAFKEQQRKKLEEAQAQGASSGSSTHDEDPSQSVPFATPSEDSRARDNSLEKQSTSNTTNSRIWSLLGFWAWDRGRTGSSSVTQEAIAQRDSDQTKQSSK